MWKITLWNLVSLSPLSRFWLVSKSTKFHLVRRWRNISVNNRKCADYFRQWTSRDVTASVLRCFCKDGWVESLIRASYRKLFSSRQRCRPTRTKAKQWRPLDRRWSVLSLSLTSGLWFKMCRFELLWCRWKQRFLCVLSRVFLKCIPCIWWCTHLGLNVEMNCIFCLSSVCVNVCIYCGLYIIG